MDMENIESCCICMCPYDDDIRPRCLPCGHNLCGTCLTDSIKNGDQKCPHCQKAHGASSCNDFPINYGMEALISEIRKLRLGVVSKDHLSSPYRPLLSGDKWQEVFNDQKGCLRNLIAISDNIEIDVSPYKEFLHQTKTKHDLVLPRIYDLAKQHEEIAKLMESEDKILTDAVEEGKHHKKTATEILRKYDKVTSAKQFEEGSDEVGRCCNIFDEWRRRCQMQLPNAKTIMTSDRLMRDTIAAFKEDQDSPRETIDLSSSHLSVTDKIKRIRRESTMPATVLQKRSASVKNSLEKGHIYAIQIERGRTRCARITLSNDEICLPHLQDGEPPAYAHTIKYSELIESLNKDCVTVFMDLYWEGSVRGRLHIQLSPDTPLARHFRSICCGESGPSYAQSTFLQVENKGSDTQECVSGGDYEKRDGNGGAPLMEGLNPDDKIYTQNCVQGIVYTRYSDKDGPKISQFKILTGEGNSRFSPTENGVFGRVQEGLETLKKAVKLDNIRKVFIDDCGVVLNF